MSDSIKFKGFTLIFTFLFPIFFVAWLICLIIANSEKKENVSVADMLSSEEETDAVIATKLWVTFLIFSLVSIVPFLFIMFKLNDTKSLFVEQYKNKKSGKQMSPDRRSSQTKRSPRTKEVHGV